VTESYLKSYWFLLPLDALDPFELGAVTVLGIADHRYVAKGGKVVGDEMFLGGETQGLRWLVEAAEPISR
jgi:hypothetical protein